MVDAGLPWTADMEAKRHGYSISNAAAAVALRTVTQHIMDNTASIKNHVLGGENPNKLLQDAVAADAELAAGGVASRMDEAEIISRGYWELSKHLVDRVVAGLPAGQQLHISGHSQGGTRASLVAMYLQKRTGVAYPTTTFAGTGASCASRMMWNANGHVSLLDSHHQP